MGPENLRQQKIAFCKIDISLDLLYQLSPPLKLRCEMLALYTMQSYFVSVFLLLQKLWTDNATRSQRVTGTASHATRHCGNLTRYWKVVVARAHFSRKNCSQLGLRKRDKYFKKDVKCLKY